MRETLFVCIFMRNNISIRTNVLGVCEGNI